MSTAENTAGAKVEQTVDAVERSADGYAPPDAERPLAGYAALVGVYGARGRGVSRDA